MKKLLLIAALLGALSPIFAQGDCQNGRYFNRIFSEITQTSNIQYGSNANPSTLNPNEVQDLFMNVYEPTGDTLSERPLVILAFGGAFVLGSKLSPDIVYLCENFAKLGYVTAAIDYRLTRDLTSMGSERLATLAVLKASHDMRAAIRYFYKDAQTSNTFRIDTSRIIIGGVSAGALTAIHTAYLDELSEIPAVVAADTAGLGGIQGLSGNPGYSTKVAGVINLCGAINDVSLIKPNDPFIVSLHGTEDETVPYGSDTITLFNLNLPVEGSASIHAHLDTAGLGIEQAFYTWQGAGHTPFIGFLSVNPTYMDTTYRFVRDFMYEWQCGASVSIGEEERLAIQSFPNPVHSNLFFKFDGLPPQQFQVQLYDMMGRKQQAYQSYDGNNIRIFVEELPAGMYVWTIQDQDGERVGEGKVLKR